MDYSGWKAGYGEPDSIERPSESGPSVLYKNTDQVGMRFHVHHGANIVLDEGGRQATRIASFCDAITFTSHPVPIGSRLTLSITYNDLWTCGLRIGATTHDPATVGHLPKFSCPDLASRSGFWIRPLPESWCASQAKLTVYVNQQGYMHLFADTSYKGAIIGSLPTRELLWFVIDLYGVAVSAKFVNNVNNTPLEVIARGPDALRAYKHACSEGSVRLHRTRLFLIGCPKAGKTSLKRALLGLKGEEQKDGQVIDAVHSCHTSDECDGAPWILENANQTVATVSTEESRNTKLIEQEVAHISQEQYEKAVAVNVVRELTLLKRRRQTGEKSRGTGRSTVAKSKSMLRPGVDVTKLHSSLQRSASTHVPPLTKDDLDTLPYELPASVVSIVENMLKNNETKQVCDVTETEKGSDESKSPVLNASISFSIWDFPGDPAFSLVNQTFFSQNGIYLLLFDLCKDLDAPLEPYLKQNTLARLGLGGGNSTMQCIHEWLAALHVRIARASNENAEMDSPETEKEAQVDKDVTSLQPSVIIVGTHRNLLDGDRDNRNNIVSEKFAAIRESLRGKPYGNHVLPMYFSVDTVPTADSADDIEEQLEALRRKIEQIAFRIGGCDIPIKWIAYERVLSNLVSRGLYFSNFYQLHELGRTEGLESKEGFRALMHYLHHQGTLFCFGCLHPGPLDSEWDGTVVLRPQWFLRLLYRLFTPQKLRRNVWTEQDASNQETRLTLDRLRGIFEDADQQIPTLIALFDTLDLVVENYLAHPSRYMKDGTMEMCMIPWNATQMIDDRVKFQNDCSIDTLVMFVDFSNLLPVGLYPRLLARVLRWIDWRDATVYADAAIIPLDRDHILVMRQVISMIQIIVRKIRDSEDWFGSTPQPSVCEKVRHLLEAELESFRQTWYCRLSFRLVVACPCDGMVCTAHHARHCKHAGCAHFLPLNECLSRSGVLCDYRRIDTDFVRMHFPHASVYGAHSQGGRRSSRASKFSANCAESELPSGLQWIEEGQGAQWGPEQEPSWMLEAAKLLDISRSAHDWTALAKRLCYTDKEISRFSEETNAPLTLLRDWLESNGGTRYSIDVLISSLRQMDRDDVASYIDNELEPEANHPSVFISYQWHAQEAILSIRQRLEFSGFTCWMDVGQMGGGDQLYGKIYEGISRAKVIICCLTPRYAASATCAREVSLADVLRKPIIPVMVEPTPWPPPGPIAIIMSSLIYVDLCGVGGHGGSGRDTDWDARCQDIVNRVAKIMYDPISMTSGPAPKTAAGKTTLTKALQGREVESAFSRGSIPFQDTAESNAERRLIDEGLGESTESPHASQNASSHTSPGAQAAGSDPSSRRTSSESVHSWQSGDPDPGPGDVAPSARTRVSDRVTRCTICVIL